MIFPLWRIAGVFFTQGHLVQSPFFGQNIPNYSIILSLKLDQFLGSNPGLHCIITINTYNNRGFVLPMFTCVFVSIVTGILGLYSLRVSLLERRIRKWNQRKQGMSFQTTACSGQLPFSFMRPFLLSSSGIMMFEGNLFLCGPQRNAQRLHLPTALA